MMRTATLVRTGIGGTDAPRVVGADGVWLLLENGERAVDAMTTTAPLGHRHPRIVGAVIEAANASPTLDEGWSTRLREQAAEAVLETAFAGESWAAGVRFALTGSEANDLALSLCQSLTGRSPIVVRERAYHGMVGLARAATVQPQWHGGLSTSTGTVKGIPRGAEVRILPFPTASFGSGTVDTEEAVETVLRDADTALAGAAAIIVDYTQGGHYANPAYQDVLARKAREASVPWIADEVITGFGKSGDFWFNFQRGVERPDLVTLGKPMGGGVVPCAAVVLSDHVMSELRDASWQTYSALRSNDMGAAAALEFIKIVDEEDLVRRAGELHQKIVTRMRELASQHGSVTRIDGQGLHWWIEIGHSDWQKWTGVAGKPTVANQVAARTLEGGALVATTGEENVILVTLPLIVNDAEVAKVFDALDHGLMVADELLVA